MLNKKNKKNYSDFHILGGNSGENCKTLVGTKVYSQLLSFQTNPWMFSKTFMYSTLKYVTQRNMFGLTMSKTIKTGAVLNLE